MLRRRRAVAFTMTAGATLAGLTFATVGGAVAAARVVHHTAAPAGAARPAYGTIAVTDNNAILIYAPSSSGNAAPNRTITGPATGFNDSYPVEFDAAGNVWVTDFNNNTILKYAGTATGNVAPLRTITTPTATDLSAPDGLALVPGQHRVWIGNDTSTTLAKFDISANGSISPAQRIVGSQTGISWSHDLALTPNGKHLWEADGNTDTLREFSTSGPTNQAPVRTISVTAGGGEHYAEGVVGDRDGNVWTSDVASNSLYEYGPKSDTVPIRTITGDKTGIANPDYIALDPNGKLWVVNGGDSSTSVPASVEQFAATANGNVAPLRQIAGAATGVTGPGGVAVYGAKPGAPQSVKARGGNHKVKVHWRTPSSTGGGLLGYVVRRKNSKHSHWATVAVTKKRHFTDRHRKVHHRYRYDVIAVNELGNSAASKTASAVAKK